MHILSTALAATALVGGALTLTGCHHRCHDPKRAQAFLTSRVDDLLDDVKATDAQRQQIHAVTDPLIARGKALHEGHTAQKTELLALWRSDQPDAARLHALVDARAAAMKGFVDEAADAALQIHAILTPEQREQLARKLERHLQE